MLKQAASFLVLGAGSWGTAFAMHLSRLRHKVYLWGKDSVHIQQMQKCRQNSKYLPEIIFPPDLKLIDNFTDERIKFNQIKHIIIAVPSHAFRKILLAVKEYFDLKNQTLIWLTKGFDPEKHQFLHQTAKEILGETLSLGVISGPSFAREAALELPTAVTFAGQDKNLIRLFHSPYFRVYYSEDIVGVQLGGAVKNVLAIAAGMAEGLNYGANTQAALITRGLAEMMRLGAACGANPETFMGLSGAGDLVLTCTNNQSRNRRFGIALAQNQSRAEAEKSIGQVVEGIQTAKEVYALSRIFRASMPIAEQIYALLYENLSVPQALENLLMRPPKIENL